MLTKSIQRFLIDINQTSANVDVVYRGSEFFICLFNIEEHKDYINGFGALGFFVQVTTLGTTEYSFEPIPVKANHIFVTRMDGKYLGNK